jgi:hypothetical protein
VALLGGWVFVYNQRIRVGRCSPWQVKHPQIDILFCQSLGRKFCEVELFGDQTGNDKTAVAAYMEA